MFRLIAALVWLEICARMVSKDPRKPVLLGLMASEPLTEFERSPAYLELFGGIPWES